MKLALIRRQFSATGGAELYLHRLLAALAERGHELHLFAEDWDQTPVNVTLHRLAAGGARAERPVRFADAVQHELARHTFDCVFSLERTRQQDVYRAGDGVHRVWLERRRQFAPWWRKLLIGRGAFHRNVLALEAETFDPRNTRRVIVNSEMVKQEILKHFSFPVDRIHLVRNGVELARFQGGDRTAARKQFGVQDDEFLLLFVGSGWERKGLKYLLAALAALQRDSVKREFIAGARLFQEASRRVTERLRSTILGSVPSVASPSQEPAEIAADKIRLLVVGKGRKPPHTPTNVIFAGAMSDVVNAYAAADLFVFLPIYEPSANVVFEAMAAGVPVVTSAQNGASELIEEQVNGTVIDDPSDLRSVLDAIAYWWSRRFYAPPVPAAELSRERNVSETLAVLEMAAKERR
jgi:UDP-glucose:(heptosyl)LPS alpha-1,3-glucosyltransferase